MSKSGDKPGKSRTPSVPRPSSSVVVISPHNEILLVHRVENGTFSSAHVFPGGNLSSFHEGDLIPAVDSDERHCDGPAYQLAAIRETYEETGVLLARPKGQAGDTLLHVSEDVKRTSRVQIADGKVRFQDWLGSVGGEVDTDRLIPFTRWVTPPHMGKRFTTQMYLYLMPLEDSLLPDSQGQPGQAADDASADRVEVMAAEYASAAHWTSQAKEGQIIMFPPQLYILAMLAPILRGGSGIRSPASKEERRVQYAAERAALVEFVHNLPPSGGPIGGSQEAADTLSPPSWKDMVISPRFLGKLPQDGRSVLGLDAPGPELRGSGRRGDRFRVVLVGNVPPGPPRNVELKLRAEVMPLLARGTKEVRGGSDRSAKDAHKTTPGLTQGIGAGKPRL